MDILNRGKTSLKEAGINDYNTDAWLLFEEAFSMDRVSYFMRQHEECNDDSANESFNHMLEVRCTHVPLQHIIGRQEFMGLDFKVNEHTLIPRQDTECLVEAALGCIDEMQRKGTSERDKLRILDMCTGSGCIAVSISKLCENGEAGEIKAVEQSKSKEAAQIKTAAERAAINQEVTKESCIIITGVDISSEALKIAEINKSIHNAANVTFVESNLFEFCGDRQDCAWDIIVSNPPYIPTREIDELEDEVRLHDPRAALDGMEDGLYFYREITEKAVCHLNKGGRLLYEIGCNQAQDVSEIMKENGFTDIKVVKDMAGLDRVVTGKLNH